ncbi:MAG: glycoside hydrolase family 3 C-terminal domain-containing protein [Bacilli bacterium]|jgi:beta-glucosidase
MNFKSILNELTLAEKAALLSGITNWKTTPISRLSIPSVFMADGPTGLRKEMPGGQFLAPSYPATCFPLPVTVASSWNPALLEKMAAALAREAIDQKVDTVLGPGVNIKRNPLGGRNFEYFSEDSYLSGVLGTAFIKGVQSQGVGTSLKHFALNNQEYRRMTISSEVDMKTMRELYLLPFEMAIKNARPATIMASYNRINGIQVTENKWLLRDLLRNKWGYQGMVVSDWNAVADRVKGVQAGLDLEMPTSNGVNDHLIIEAVQSGRLSLKDVDEAVGNVLRYIDYSLAQRPKKERKPYDYTLSHDLARKMAVEGAVLLKNDNEILPLDPTQPLAVIGRMAREPRYQGSGSSKVNPKNLVPFTDALARQGILYQFAPGYDKNDRPLVKEAVALARSHKIAVVFIGLSDVYESEGFDRSHLNLSKGHLDLVNAVVKANPRTVVVLALGAPVVLPFINEIPAVLNLYLAGEAFGEAAADLLFGSANPSGKLAETFPLKLEDVASYGHFPMGPRQVKYQEGLFVGYRHHDRERHSVLFPFGHGLSYTKFRYRHLVIESEFPEKRQVNLTLDVTNIGTRTGQEVVQVYVAPHPLDNERPVQTLQAFEKITLDPGETKTVHIVLDETAFRVYDEKTDDWALAGGEYRLRVGSSSRDIRISDLVFIETPVVLGPKVKIAIPEYRSINPEENVAYTRNNLDSSATIADVKNVSLNGWLFYQAIGLFATKMVKGKLDKVTKQMVRQGAVMMPLRQLVPFSGGKISKTGLDGIIMILKGHPFRGLKTLLADLKNNKNHGAKTDTYPIEAET